MNPNRESPHGDPFVCTAVEREQIRRISGASRRLVEYVIGGKRRPWDSRTTFGVFVAVDDLGLWRKTKLTPVECLECIEYMRRLAPPVVRRALAARDGMAEAVAR